MVKKLILFLLVLPVLAIFSVQLISAEVWFTIQPEPLYNIGDSLKVSVSVPETGSQLEVELSCKNESKLIFLKHLEKETSVDILQPLTKSFLNDIRGWCTIVARYGQAITESSKFAISYSVFLNIKTDKMDYYPGEQVNVKGEAEKANTLLLEGFFKLEFDSINFSTEGTIKKGVFETNVTLPEDIAAGNYLVNITAYEKEGEEITSKGEQVININAKQMPKKVEIAFNSQRVKPGNNLEFRIMLYDQSEAVIENEASFLIEDYEGKLLTKGFTSIDKSESFYIEKNLSSGYYKVKSYSSGIYGERQFYVEENEEVEFEITNGTLLIRNVGNVKYDEPIQVKISDVIEVVNTELEVGAEKKYELLAPDGKYDIIVTDGRSTSEGKVGLTGNAISVKEESKKFFAKNKSLAWIFLILVMGMFIFVSARRVLKKKFVLSELPSKLIKRKVEKGKGVIKVGKEEKVEIIKEPREAEHSLVLKGQKHNIPIICIKVKNEISKTAGENLQQILKRVHESRGVIYNSGAYNLAIFSPLVTKTFKNYVPAIKTALDIARALKEHNRKFSDKIEFGIGVHSGNVVSSLKENKLLFTSLGNTLSLAKKIADASKGEILLSKELHEKTLVDIKAEKTERQGMEVFTISRVADTEKNKLFVQDFLKRLAEQGKQQKQQNQ